LDDLIIGADKAAVDIACVGDCVATPISRNHADNNKTPCATGNSR
jgi:hypothetical protein